MAVTLRWLGVAGIEIVSNGQTLLIDPYLTRVPIWKFLLGHIQPNLTATAKIQRADFILVTHSHFDHLLDVPEIMKGTGAVVHGSENTFSLLKILGVSEDEAHVARPWDRLPIGSFDIEVFPFKHARVLGYGCGRLRRNLKPPLHATDYRMDYGICYRVKTDGLSLLTDAGYRPDVNAQSDILLTQPFHGEAYYRELLSVVQPKMVVPVHWDNLFSYSDKRPFFRPPTWRHPMRRINLDAFSLMINKISPTVEVRIPRPFDKFEVGMSVRQVRHES